MDRLENTVRPYAWGSTTAIPELLGEEPTGEPRAELWMGAHPGAPSRIDRGAGSTPLSEVIAAAPEEELGAASVRAHGPRLPFLLKLLAAAAPLSLQVHPDNTQAAEGYADEEARGVPLDSPERNYKDASHKPELICALTPFEGLCGFRQPHEAAELLEGLGVNGLKPYADILRARPGTEALREVLTAILSAEKGEMAETVAEAAEAAARMAAVPAVPSGSSGRSGEAEEEGLRREYAAYADIAHHYPGDPGVLAAMLLNHVSLRPGEALFLSAGVPHAYLSGLGVEIMANSDNVLRCGLTPKHVDVSELLRVVRFEPTDPGILRPEADDTGGEEIYDTPVGEFRLSRFTPVSGAAPHTLQGPAAQILLCTGGEAVLQGDESDEITLAPGRSAYVPAGERVRISGDGTLFRATVAV
ncbi:MULTISPECIES: mannose-6-phosphate isomerase, class I [unclassified Streptomyces]|uniref:mannose-6-phosphate isomerase, class I n=1 Tax=unclassified Streptomyces TaxID=2593676 RepID=UPI002DDC1D34|nr:MULTISPECIES: mannose-6-phosphate isomerase, class I [unclassified Streptomyces]WSA94369.1 mannose-6-phosphate isomerase, class I [Streptomyces sp. NBC_01795]WSB78787.1 mannose-6-phosphate isomerase, class I [Streptomyces sp. NBC_01775]WSS13009.1 mannose-6-phosphate isomerase, class I [Streptomyces sp. NBC_01186]WSS41793.1 mannose-6-phosphate isomerase, class I [Streptomyces sp. NBC_01187]